MFSFSSALQEHEYYVGIMSWYGYEEYYATQEYHETTQEDHDTTQEDHDTTQEHHDTTQEHYDTTQEHYDTTQEHNDSSYGHDSSTQTPLMESDSMLGVSSLIVVLGLLGVAIFWWRRCKTWYKGTQSILHSTYHRLFSLIHISNFRVTFRFVVSLTVDVCFVVNDQRGHNYVWFSYR